MHPALSVIFFTVVSGCGYGLLFATGIVLLLDPQLLDRGETLCLLALGGSMAAAGLGSSLLHLGQPQRAWRAFSQWRTSWLSREGVAAVLSFAPLLALAWLSWRGGDSAALRVAAGMLALSAVITVFCTARIYTSLPTIPAWHNAYVLPGYLLLGLLGGLAMLQLVSAWSAPVWSDRDDMERLLVPWVNHILVQWCCAALIALLALAVAALKLAYWRHLEAPASVSIDAATGLGRFGAVRSVEAPHTEQNYLTHEMGFVLARKHARRLRRISLALLLALPLPLALLLLLPDFASQFWISASCSAAIAASILAGTFVERWLFFAEAKHVVMLYYGAQGR